MSNIKLLKGKKDQTECDLEKAQKCFRIADIMGILVEKPDTTRVWNHWKVLKNRLFKEGNETYTNCKELKLQDEVGKMRLTEVGNGELIFKLVQSIPSPKLESFKNWLANIGYERINEIQELHESFDRVRQNWQGAKSGFSNN
jgi:DNA-damage-inducible protein D